MATVCQRENQGNKKRFTKRLGAAISHCSSPAMGDARLESSYQSLASLDRAIKIFKPSETY